MTAWHPGLDLPVTPDTGTLVAYGRIRWDEVPPMLTGSQAAWADYDGFHIGAPPGSPPPYSHLWAWTPQWLARIRIDGEHAITGVLALRGAPEIAPPERWRRLVEYQHVESRTWPRTEKRVGPVPADVAGQATSLYLIGGQHPVTFISVS